MKLQSFLLAAFLIMGCNTADQVHENEMTPLLTAKAWKMSEKDLGTIKFNADGTYQVEFKNPTMDIKIGGVWEWMSATEIVMTKSDFIYEKKIEKMNWNSDDKDVIRITSLTADKLDGIWHHFLDAEDSGFAKPITYVAE